MSNVQYYCKKYEECPHNHKCEVGIKAYEKLYERMAVCEDAEYNDNVPTKTEPPKTSKKRKK